MRATLLFTIGGLSGLIGCSHGSGSSKSNDDSLNTVMVDGFIMWREAVEDDFKKIKSKAAFDLSTSWA